MIIVFNVRRPSYLNLSLRSRIGSDLLLGKNMWGQWGAVRVELPLVLKSFYDDRTRFKVATLQSTQTVLGIAYLAVELDFRVWLWHRAPTNLIPLQNLRHEIELKLFIHANLSESSGIVTISKLIARINELEKLLRLSLVDFWRACARFCMQIALSIFHS